VNRRRFLTTTGAGVGAVSALGAVGELALGDREPDILPASRTPTPGTWDDNAITLAWLGHATVLINFYGLRILTDPVLFPRIGVDVWFRSIGPRRITACALPPSQLPEIDLVLLSHAHFDHLDTPSLAALPGRPIAITASRVSDLLPRKRFASIHELWWGDSSQFKTRHGEVEITALEVKHWGARLMRDTYRGYSGYVIRREGRALLFGGDTARTPMFGSHRRYGPFEAAIMPIGAYDPFIHNHCTPEQAVTMADAAGARLFVPIHHKSFKLSAEPFSQPIERAEEALRQEAGRLVVRAVGDTVRVA
jgi:L-ascorbate metabolism protein UlaG (beta-lactamase superfamily)